MSRHMTVFECLNKSAVRSLVFTESCRTTPSKRCSNSSLAQRRRRRFSSANVWNLSRLFPWGGTDPTSSRPAHIIKKKANRQTSIRFWSHINSWPLATLWLTDELSKSASAYKHASLDRPVGCPSSIVVWTKHVSVLFSKTTVSRFVGCDDRTVNSNSRGVWLRLSEWAELCLLATGQLSTIQPSWYSLEAKDQNCLGQPIQQPRFHSSGILRIMWAKYLASISAT